MSRPTLHAAARLLAVAGASAGLLAAGALTEKSATIGSRATTTEAARIALTESTLTCPGPELVGIEGVDDVATRPLVVADTAPAAVLAAQAISPTGTAPRGTAGLSAAPLAAPGSTADGRTSTATAGEIAWRVPDDATSAVAVTATGTRAPGLVAAQESLVTDAPAAELGVRGLMSLACTPATADAWLIAGGGGAGRQERLVLVNPGANPATAVVSVHGVSTSATSVTGHSVTIAPYGRSSVLLDGLAPDEDAPAVHVDTRSGLVSATLVDTWVDGVTPRGIDATGPAAPEGLRQLIPAVAGPDPARVRIVATGPDQALVQVRLVTRDGREPLPSGAGVVRVAGGATADVEIASLPSDVVGVEVVADAPVVAGAMLSRGVAGKTTDFAWVPALPAIRGAAGTAFRPLSDGDATATRTLSIVASGGRAEGDVTLVAADGSTIVQRVRLDADTSATVDVSTATAVWIAPVTGGGQLRAAVVTRLGSGADGRVTVRALTSARFTGRDLPVVQRRQ